MWTGRARRALSEVPLSLTPYSRCPWALPVQLSWRKLRFKDVGLFAQGCIGVRVQAGHETAGKVKGIWEAMPWLLWNRHSLSLTTWRTDHDGGIMILYPGFTVLKALGYGRMLPNSYLNVWPNVSFQMSVSSTTNFPPWGKLTPCALSLGEFPYTSALSAAVTSSRKTSCSFSAPEFPQVLSWSSGSLQACLLPCMVPRLRSSIAGSLA